MSDLSPPAGDKPRILIVGGYGVFGGRLSRRLAKHQDIEVIVAGRSLAKATAHCAAYGGTPAAIDTGGDLEAAFQIWRPIIIIDAAGPFQNYGEVPYRVASAALGCGAHYMDLADDALFVAGIVRLDTAAKRQGRVALSGCSSVPAISAAATATLAARFQRIDSIETVILPGNRAPRGPSVMAAILAQVGKPIAVWRGGTRSSTNGWCSVTRLAPHIAGVEPLPKRHVSPIGAPDLQLFGTHFGAPTVRFEAGLELSVMHVGLTVIAWAVRLGMLRSATSLSGPLTWIANRLEPFGTDRGAMVVEVRGRTAERLPEAHRWTLIAEAGDGPEIPPTPAYLLALTLARKTRALPSGAHPCLEELTLAEIELGLKPFAITTSITKRPIAPLFETALPKSFAALPPAIKTLHDVLDIRRFAGRAQIDRGRHPLAKLIGWCMRFPPETPDVAMTVEMQRTDTGETWTRTFGDHSFRSHLSRQTGAPEGQIWERFGPLSFRIDLIHSGGTLRYPVTAARFLGLIPLPTLLLPVSETREFVDDASRAFFDVSISHPLAGFIVRYRGHLTIQSDVPLDPQGRR